VLAAEGADDARFFVVWVNRGIGDDRESVDPELLADERVTQYWDPEGLAGRHYADGSGFAYDVYYVYGPDAAWQDRPIEEARPVVDAVDRLLAQL
jgi:hypothetical protein